MTGYEIYVEWCRDHQRKPPSKAWWDKACAQPKTIVFEPDFDIDTERREGWTYGES
jgi:hypothetical protein